MVVKSEAIVTGDIAAYPSSKGGYPGCIWIFLSIEGREIIFLKEDGTLDRGPATSNRSGWSITGWNFL